MLQLTILDSDSLLKLSLKEGDSAFLGSEEENGLFDSGEPADLAYQLLPHEAVGRLVQ